MKRLMILVLALALLVLPAPLHSQTGGRAGLVIQFGDGRVVTQCVSFEGESISGLELLQRSGLELIAQVSGIGAAVCKIGDQGCNYPAEPCFCQSSGQTSRYWSYWRLRNGAWQYSMQGASASRVRNGDVDGWAWGNPQAGTQPPLIPFEQICPAAAAPSAPPPPSPTPTAAPPSATPRPVLPTAAPSATPRPVLPTTAPSATSAPLALAPTTTQPPATATATATPAPSATGTPTAGATPAPSATGTPTAGASPPSRRPPTVTPTPAAAQPVTTTPPRSYLVFGALLAAVLGAIAVALRRRR